MSTTKKQVQTVREILGTSKSVVIDAGAGCGKTSLLVKIGAEIINSDESVLFLNMTRRACIEIHSHAEEFGLTSIRREQVRTFHSLAFEYLNKWKGVQFNCGFPYWNEDAYRIPNEIDGCSDERLFKILYKMSHNLNTGLDRKNLIQIAGAYKECLVARIPTDRLLDGLRFKLNERLDEVEPLVQQYEGFRLREGLYSYQDALEIFSSVLMRTHADQLRSRYQTVILDECQDVSSVQLDILISLANAGCRIILAGDPRQCINTFMGAYTGSFEDIKVGLRPRVFNLNHSFRFGQPIADMANAVAKFMEGSSFPLVGNVKKASVTPIVVKTFCSKQMVDLVANEIEELISSKSCRPCDILVCYRFTKGNRLASRLSRILKSKEIEVVQLPLQSLQREILDQLTQLTEKLYKRFNSNIGLAASIAIKKHKRNFGNGGSLYGVFRKIADEADSMMDLIVDCKDRAVEYLLRQSPDAVVMSTIHSSKGSGYEYVFLLDSSEYAFSERMKFTRRIEADQAALLYVAVTRAKHQFRPMYPVGRRLSRILKPYVAGQSQKSD